MTARSALAASSGTVTWGPSERGMHRPSGRLMVSGGHWGSALAMPALSAVVAKPNPPAIKAAAANFFIGVARCWMAFMDFVMEISDLPDPQNATPGDARPRAFKWMIDSCPQSALLSAAPMAHG